MKHFFIGFTIALVISSLDYNLRIKPNSLSGQDLKIVPVFYGTEMIDVWVPAKMRELVSNSNDQVTIPETINPEELRNALNNKADSIQSIHGKIYSLLY